MYVFISYILKFVGSSVPFFYSPQILSVLPVFLSSCQLELQNICPSLADLFSSSMLLSTRFTAEWSRGNVSSLAALAQLAFFFVLMIPLSYFFLKLVVSQLCSSSNTYLLIPCLCLSIKHFFLSERSTIWCSFKMLLKFKLFPKIFKSPC